MLLICTGRNRERREPGVERMKLRLRVTSGIVIILSVILWLIDNKGAIYMSSMLLAKFEMKY